MGKRLTNVHLLRLLAVSIVWGLILVMALPAAAEDPDVQTYSLNGTVQTDLGEVAGVLQGGTYVFKGIPYAAPPVGDLRWRPPAPAVPWSGILDASKFGPRCAQMTNRGIFKASSEDCLRLNIWAPAHGSGARPVIFWIHGSGHTAGNSVFTGNFYSDGQYFAEQHGLIVVSVEFRVGVFGYLAHPLLDQESSNDVSGNYGALDEIAALQWVHRNIRAFGGDPERLTVEGFSAGGTDVCILMSSDLSRGLLSGAVMESAADCGPFPTLAEAETTGSTVVSKAGCAAVPDVMACMRALPRDAVLSALPPTFGLFEKPVYGPNFDGYLMKGTPGNILKKVRHHHVPLLIGSNANDAALFVDATMIPDEPAYKAQVQAFYGPVVGDQLLAQYPADAYSSPAQALIALGTDGFFACPARRVARELNTKDAGVFRYVFAHTFASGAVRAMGAFHSAEIPFVYHSFQLMPYQQSPTEELLSVAMNGYWADFAATGDPNGASSPTRWPLYGENDPYLRLDYPIDPDTAFRNSYCDLWDSLFATPSNDGGEPDITDEQLIQYR